MPLLATLALFATALCLGGMVFFTIAVAPTLHRALSRDAAGQFLRALFPIYYLYVFATAGAAAVALIPLSGTAAGIMIAVAGLAIWSRQVMTPRINTLRELRAAGDADAARRFGRLHRISVLANILMMAAAIAVLAGF
jgi:uncharacterized membrane protein